MSDHASKDSTAVAERLAHLLNSEQGVRSLRLLARLNSDQKDSGVAPQTLLTATAMTTPGRVGIWQLESDDEKAGYVRLSLGRTLGVWSDRPRIELKGSRRRVVLLGESVARGLFYDPWFNPSAALEKILGANDETSDIEVIDLAQSGCSSWQLMQLLSSCLQLGPDALVIFAGNNWDPYETLNRKSLLDIADRLYLRQRLEEVRGYIEERLRLSAESIVESIAAVAKAHSLPVVIIIPEFNLCDWRTDCIETIDFLPPSEAMRWRRARGEAEAALRERNFSKAAALAEEMIDLDRETTSASLEILARCKIESGEVAEARRLLEKAKDSVLSFRGGMTPRCYSVIQDVFRARAGELGMEVVDLPQRFKEYLGGGIPDKRLFLDYCHLTVEGIRVAMASAAEKLLPIFGASERSWTELAEVEMNVSDSVRAIAHFGAAIHNSHWGQGYEIVHFHCREVIDLNPEIADSMVHFLDYYIRRMPSLFCRSFLEADWGENKPYWLIYMNVTLHPQRDKILNRSLVEAMLEVLEPITPEIEKLTLKLLLEQRGIGDRDLDLLNPLHWCPTYSVRERMWSAYFGYYVSFTPESLFQVVCRRGQSLILTLTHRIREDSAWPLDVIVYVNNVATATLEGALSWRTDTIRVPSEYLQDGFNTIIIAWPGVEWSEAKETRRVAAELEFGSIPLIFPVYGELHTFRASTEGADFPIGR